MEFSREDVAETKIGEMAIYVVNKKIKCMSCHEEITPLNDGMEINGGEFYQCSDCHFIEFGYNIYACNLIFNGRQIYKNLIFDGKRMGKLEILHYPVEVDGNQSIQFIMMAEKLLIGSCMLWRNGFLGDFHIAHGWRKRGLGDAMFKKVKEIATFNNLKTIWGTCMRINPAIKFWIDRGFKIVGDHDEDNYKIEIGL
jgi:GNAT superfamily N-acetyltransferase